MNTTKSINYRHLIAGATLAVTFGSLAAVSHAADSTDMPQLKVNYGDLNVSSPKGAATLYARIQTAAEGVCHGLEDRSLAFKVRFEACIQKAIAGAVTKVGEPSLTAVYVAKNGSPKQIVLASSQR
jgi:UrcA family protein